MHGKVIAGVFTTIAVLGTMACPALGANRRYSARVTNAYYPLLPGIRWEYRGVKNGRPLRDVVLVTHRTESIGGVRCAVVVDRVQVDRRLAESTVDGSPRTAPAPSGTSVRRPGSSIAPAA